MRIKKVFSLLLIAVLLMGLLPHEVYANPGEYFSADGLKYLEWTEAYSYKNGKVELVKDNYNETSYVIPATVQNAGKTYDVTEIGYGTFDKSSNLTDVTFFGEISSIWGFAFRDCINLKEITFFSPKPPEGLGKGVFSGVPAGLKIFVPEGAVDDYYNALSLVLPAGVSILPMSFFDIGEGTEDNPYQINTARQLYNMAQLVNTQNDAYGGKHYILTSDIQLGATWRIDEGNTILTGGTAWTPIGIKSSSFNGSLDGQGHTISGLYINSSSAEYQGLFGFIGASGRVKNVGVVGSYVRGYKILGGVVGYNNGTVSNSYNTGSISGVDYIGGVAGLNNSIATVSNSYNTGNISGTSLVGGVVGSNGWGTVSNSYSTGSVSGTKDVGGVVGGNGGTVSNSYYETVVSPHTSAIGFNIGTVVSVSGKASEDFASGEVAYLLQSGQTPQVWGQALSGGSPDVAPILTDNGSKMVFKAASFMNATKEISTVYWNTQVGAVTIPTPPVGMVWMVGRRSYLAGDIVPITKYTIFTATEAKNILIRYTAPTDITGVVNGAEKSALGLGLPSIVAIVTSDGNREASVEWNVEDCAYNQITTAQQTFLVYGRMKLPLEVTNPSDLELTFSINVTVEAAVIVNAIISPTTVVYDLDYPADVSTTITWNSAQTVTNVVYGGVYLSPGSDYAIDVNNFTIKEDYLDGLHLSEGESTEFSIFFNKGDSTLLTVNIEKSYIPGNDSALSELKVDGKSVTGFIENEYEYTILLPYSTQPGSAATIVSATPRDPKAGISIYQTTMLPGKATVEVMAEDGSIKTYNIYFNIVAPVNAIINPIIFDFEKNSTSRGDISTIIIWQDAFSVVDVKNSGISIGTESYSVSGNILTIKEGYLIAQSIGLLPLIVEFDTGNPVILTVNISDTTVVPTAYTVTFDSQGGTSVPSIFGVASGSSISTPTTPTRGGYTFGGWYKESSCINVWNFSTDLVTGNITIYSKWTYNVGSGGGGGYSSESTTILKPLVNVLDTNGNVIQSIVINQDRTTTTASVEVSSALLTSAFDKSKIDYKGFKRVVVNIPKLEGVTGYELIVPARFLDSGDASRLVEIRTDIAVVTVPSNMLLSADTTGAQKASLTIAVGEREKLDATIQSEIGDRPVIQLNLKIDGKQTTWSNENSPVFVTVPYRPKMEELDDPEHIVIWYIDGSGKAVSVPSGRYDSVTGTVTFATNHFSYYAIAFVQKTFDDLGSVEWARKPIEVLTSKGILEGTSENEYTPESDITRADFLCFLIRTLGVDAKFDENFDDISRDAYYYKEIGIAQKLGITNGTGNNKFNPNANITRQDMMVLTNRALEKHKGLNATGDKTLLDRFIDKGEIAEYASESLTTLVKEGIISGSGNKLNPLQQTTRAEAAVFLFRIYNKY